MKILVYSNAPCSISFIDTILRYGNTVDMWFPVPKKVAENWTHDEKGLQYVYKNFHSDAKRPFEQWVNQDADFVLIDYNNINPKHLKAIHARHKNVIGPHALTDALESDRAFGKAVAAMFGGVAMPPNGKFFSDKNEAVDYVKRLKGNVVLKPARGNAVIPINRYDAIDQLKNDVNGFFKDKQKPGVFIEGFVQGQEIAFGTWFGKYGPSNLFILTREYKGAMDNNQGNVLTGEMGTAYKFVMLGDLPIAIRLFFGNLYKLLGKINYVGFIDINTIYDSLNEKYLFLEWTTRPGYPTEAELALSMRTMKIRYDKFLGWMAGVEYKPDISKLYNKKGIGVNIAAQGIGYATSDSESLRNIYYNGKPLKHRTKLFAPESGKQVLFAPIESGYSVDGNVQTIGYDRVLLLNSVQQTEKEDPSEEVYSVLKNIQCWGTYWRTDIGIHEAESNPSGYFYPPPVNYEGKNKSLLEFIQDSIYPNRQKV